MEKKTVSRKLYIITVIVLLILAGYLGSGWRESTRDERFLTHNFSMIEATLGITFPENTLFYEIFDKSAGSPRSDGDTLRLFIIQPQSMKAFAEQLKQLGWIEYTSDMYDALDMSDNLWGFWVHDEIPWKDFTHGYVLFMGSIIEPDSTDDDYASFYYTDGERAAIYNQAMLFYGTVTGRLYFFTHNS